MQLLLKDEVYSVIGAAMDVHSELGPGFLEGVYQEAMEIELEARGIPYERLKEIQICYKGRPLKQSYRADLVCYAQIIVELKALDRLTGREQAQLLNYLRATGLRVGLLVNFGSVGHLEWRRLVC